MKGEELHMSTGYLYLTKELSVFSEKRGGKHELFSGLLVLGALVSTPQYVEWKTQTKRAIVE